MNPKALAEHRRLLKEAGICTSCHRNSARQGYVTCQSCQDRINLSRANRIDRYRKEQRCVDCGVPNYEWKEVRRCGFCLEKHAEQTRAWRSIQ